MTGNLGSSAAGLKALTNKLDGFEDVKQRHLEPRCRVDIISSIAPYASSMIDISDGLAGELYHVSRQSRCRLLVFEGHIPISDSVKRVSEIVHESALSYAYSGGEDFELLYTISPKDRKHAVGFEIGVVEDGEGVFVERGKKKEMLERRGWEHFR